ncbi:alpha/beta hydrolase [Methylovulum sp.]|uniref:alpha/beta fold hydrolase n=1 Tax=Methylovulum sp. TaxID=1916980 RepID=UPI002617CC8F|nr:alpha/beta hydrolase [Methylovulum sp.]MDD5124328.1 alpha/beta hydrolase [Methylovulum sp.]
MKKLFTKGITVLMVALLSGCASLPNSTTEKINNRHIEFALTQHNTIPIVFENGLGGRIEWWKEVLPEISKDTTTFVYNRPGYGNSDPVSTPRDGSHVVDELRSLLRSKGLNPPYILVGHSLGGLYMQFFARRYPDEVSALILVDSTHPKQLDGEGAIEKQSFWVRGLIGALVTGTAKEELNLLPQTGEQLLSLPTLLNKPVFVLSASEPMEEKSKLADDANEKRKDIARLYPGSKQIWVDSGHGIPLEKPESVISAIREVLTLKQANLNEHDRHSTP